jgi:hypothetical protein
VSEKRSISTIISTELPLNEVWNSLLTPDPFPGNLFSDNGTTYVCYPLGTGRIGGYRFEYGKHNWLIMRLTSADLNSQRIRWDLVDIKASPIKNLEVSLELSSDEGATKIDINLRLEYSFWANLINFYHQHKLKKKLASFAI